MGVCGVEDGDEDLDLCAVEEVWEIGTGQAGANVPDGFPPRLVDLDEFDPWAKYFGPASGFYLWEKLGNDTGGLAQQTAPALRRTYDERPHRPQPEHA